MTVISSFFPVRTRPFHAMFNTIPLACISFCQVNITPLTNVFPNSYEVLFVTLTLHLWHMIFYGIHFLAPQQVLESHSVFGGLFGLSRYQYTSDNSFQISYKILSLVASQSVMSLRPLNRQMLGLILQSGKDYSFVIIWRNFELGGILIGYVIATSEPADSQVSSVSPARTISLSSYDKILTLVAS